MISSNLLHIGAVIHAKGDQVRRLLIMDIIARIGRGGTIEVRCSNKISEQEEACEMEKLNECKKFPSVNCSKFCCSTEEMLIER
jgi:hypothetical protein